MDIAISASRWDREALELLRLEFYGRYSIEDFYSVMHRELANSSETLTLSKEGRASNMFLMTESGNLIGVLFNKYYLWTKIGPQLHFRPHYHEGKVTGISLCPFYQLAGNQEELNRRTVGELAYFLVSKTERGKGLGGKLFEHALNDFREVLTESGDVAMTLSLGNYAHTNIGRQIKAYLLEREQANNGVDTTNGRIRVMGEVLSNNQAMELFNLNLESIASSDRSIATEILATKRGMRFVGFSSNLSLVFLAEMGSLL